MSSSTAVQQQSSNIPLPGAGIWAPVESYHNKSAQNPGLETPPGSQQTQPASTEDIHVEYQVPELSLGCRTPCEKKKKISPPFAYKQIAVCAHYTALLLYSAIAH